MNGPPTINSTPLRLISPPPLDVMSLTMNTVVQSPEPTVSAIPSSMMMMPMTRFAPIGGGSAGTGGGGGGSAAPGSDIHCLPLRRPQPRLAPVRQPFAVEKIVSIEGNDLALGGHEMDAGTLHLRDAEIEPVEKLHDDNPEDLVIAKARRDFELRQAAEQAAQGGVGLIAGAGK